MATEKTDFLKFNAYSMKELITRKMSEDSRFTDQIYEGSNLAILIDLVAYMYQVLVYQLNNAASETMFSDTQIYENISRLVRLIGYNPSGCAPTAFQLGVQRTDEQAASTTDGLQRVVIPFYSRVSTGKTDRNGREIYFSTATENNTSGEEGGTVGLERGSQRVLNVFNGEWKLYGTVFTAAGTENETFTLTGVGSDSARQMYVSTEMVNVVIRRGDEFDVSWTADKNGIFLNYTNDQSIYNTNNTNIYDPSSKVYSVRLNQDKEYEITFGNGIVGAKLQKGDLIYVFYLDSNGPDGEIDVNDIDWSTVKLEHNRQMFGLDEETYRGMFQLGEGVPTIEADGVEYMLYQLRQTTSKFIPEQGVDEIRENAPNWFKCGNRLVTPQDYQYFIKNVVYVRDFIPDLNVVDVRCMNNTDYVATFLKWLYLNGRQSHGDGRYYFNSQQFWNQHQYVMADPADANNTYLWIKSDGQDDEYDVQQVEQRLNQCLNPVKTMTTEIKVLKPVLVNFDICANPSYEYIKTVYLESLADFDSGADSYIEVTIDNQAVFSGNQLQKEVYDVITNYFTVAQMKMGQNVDFGAMTSGIYQLGGVRNVRTVYRNPFTDQYYTANGLAFASWSPILQTTLDGDGTGYDDLQVSTSSRKMEDFQFPVFVGQNTLMKRIKIISKTQTQVNAAGQ